MNWFLNRTPVADLIAFEGGLLTVQTNARPDRGQLKVTARLPGGENFGTTLRVLHEVVPDEPLQTRCRELGYPTRRRVYCTAVVAPAGAVEHLEVLLDPLPRESDHHHRQAERCQCCLRVRSPQLPNFQGHISDLSATGARLQALGEVPVGAELDLHIEFVGPPNELDLRARVLRCVGADKGFELGVEFEAVTELETRLLRDFLASAQQAWDWSVSHG